MSKAKAPAAEAPAAEAPAAEAPAAEAPAAEAPAAEAPAAEAPVPNRDKIIESIRAKLAAYGGEVLQTVQTELYQLR